MAGSSHPSAWKVDSLKSNSKMLHILNAADWYKSCYSCWSSADWRSRLAVLLNIVTGLDVLQVVLEEFLAEL